MAVYKQVNKLDYTDAAYIAGLIDGEGTITMTKRHKNENRQLVISISNNEKQLLEYVLLIAGVGTLSSKRIYKLSHSTNYSYKVSNRQAYGLLRQIIPYMKSYKKDRAVLILKKYLKLTPRNGKYTKRLELERNGFIKEFLKSHHKSYIM